MSSKVYKIYKLSFKDGQAYVGMTYKSLYERVIEHSTYSKSVNQRLYTRLQTEIPKIELLNITSFGRYNASRMEQDYIKEIPEQHRLNIVVKGSTKTLKGAEFGSYDTKKKRTRNKEVKLGEYICSKCRIKKPHTEYHKDRTRFNGLHSTCKDCKGKAATKYKYRYKSHQGKKVLKSEYKRVKKPPRLCSVEGCNIIHRAHGYCNKHQMRVKRHGDPSVRVYDYNNGQCKVRGCDENQTYKGLCEFHYYRFKRGIDLDKPRRKYTKSND